MTGAEEPSPTQKGARLLVPVGPKYPVSLPILHWPAVLHPALLSHSHQEKNHLWCVW